VICKSCDYCGEEDGTVVIPDPNEPFGGKTWRVCGTCEKVIEYQRGLSLAQIEKDEKMEKYFTKKLFILSKETGKQILCACIDNTECNEIVFGDGERGIC